LIRLNELARSRSIELTDEQVLDLVVPVAIGYMCDQKLREMKQSLADVDWKGLVENVLDDREQLTSMFEYVVDKVQPKKKLALPTDEDVLKNYGYGKALDLFEGDYAENDTSICIDLTLIKLLMDEYVKNEQ